MKISLHRNANRDIAVTVTFQNGQVTAPSRKLLVSPCLLLLLKSRFPLFDSQQTLRRKLQVLSAFQLELELELVTGNYAAF